MNQIDLNGQVAVITGGASGFGLGTAKRLIASGAKVSLWDRDPATLKQAVDLLGSDASSEVVDVTDYAGLEAAHARVEKAVGPVSILLNSAGIAGKNAPLDEYGLDEWKKVIDVNLTGTFHVNRVVLPSMKERNYGRIVNISSIGGYYYQGGGAALYSVTKAAINRMTEVLAVEWTRNHINVNAIAPGTFRSEMMDGMMERVGDFTEMLPRQRIGEPHQLDSTLLYLVSPASELVTGTIIKVDDGQGGR